MLVRFRSLVAERRPGHADRRSLRNELGGFVPLDSRSGPRGCRRRGWLYEEPIEYVGSFGFSQFGGPGNSTGYDENVPLEDQQFTDIAVIDVADGFTPLPEVTTWESATDDLSSLADDTVNITSVGNPTAGPVTKSGRTTGMTHGEIVVTDAEDTHILDGWSNIGGHIVRGFSSNVEATQGDSGGSVIQGGTAVGVISGGVTAEDNGGEQWTWSTLLTDALPYTDGYEVALHIDAPVVTAPESGSTVEVGSTVTGTAPGAESVEITMGGSTSTVSVTDGAFSFAAPGEAGDYTYSLVGVNGYDSSAATAYELSVEEAPTPAPVISSPADGAAVVDVVTEVSGTGVPNAEVVVTIDDTEYTTTVDGAGNWTVADLELSYGSHTISAVQTANEDTSDAATVTFEIVLTAPEVTSITDGTAFAHDDAPSNLEGTGIDGATVTVELSGAEPAAGEMRRFRRDQRLLHRDGGRRRLGGRLRWPDPARCLHRSRHAGGGRHFFGSDQRGVRSRSGRCRRWRRQGR